MRVKRRTVAKKKRDAIKIFVALLCFIMVMVFCGYSIQKQHSIIDSIGSAQSTVENIESDRPSMSAGNVEFEQEEYPSQSSVNTSATVITSQTSDTDTPHTDTSSREISSSENSTDISDTNETTVQNIIPENDANNSTIDENIKEKLIAITFDDGPTKNTGRVMDILAKYNSKATFFMVGVNIPGKEDDISRMQREGHQIGNHTYNHSNLTKLDAESVKEHIEYVDNLILNITGIKPFLMRPPYGSYNEVVSSVARDTGHSIIMWDIDPRDWDVKNTKIVSDHVLEKAKDGSIILLHDFYDTSVEAADIILATLTERGYKFVTVDELLSRNGNPLESGAAYRHCYSAVETN